MKRGKNTSASGDRLDPLDEELDFSKLARVKLGKGWEEVPKQLRGPKHLDEARDLVKRKGASNPAKRHNELQRTHRARE